MEKQRKSTFRTEHPCFSETNVDQNEYHFKMKRKFTNMSKLSRWDRLQLNLLNAVLKKKPCYFHPLIMGKGVLAFGKVGTLLVINY